MRKFLLSGSSSKSEERDLEKTLPTRRSRPDSKSAEAQIPALSPVVTAREEELNKAFGKKTSPERRDYWRGQEYAIQPHTDEGGDAYYIGDAYEKIKCADEWQISNPGPYLQFVKHLSKTWRHLEYLAHWMEVTAAPPKWKFLRHYDNDPTQEGNRAERAQRTKVSVIDYTDGQLAAYTEHDKPILLRTALIAAPQSTSQRQVRLIISEDVSRDLVDMLGSFYDIDPLFFLSHINDYLFHNTRDPWAQLPCLDLDARTRSHFSLQYLRARYFETEQDFRAGERQTGLFNVLRRLDSDRSRERLQDGLLDRQGASVSLARAKTSVWIKPRQPGEPVTAILLVDPSITKGHPLWGSYQPFEDSPTMETWKKHPEAEFEAPKRETVYEDIVSWSRRRTSKEIASVLDDPRCIALPMYKLILADWLCVVKYMTTMLTKIEWEFEKPHWGEKFSAIDETLRKLSPWRRNVGMYQTMITEAIARLFPPEFRATLPAASNAGVFEADIAPELLRYQPSYDWGMFSLWPDFRNIHRQMNEVHARIRAIEAIAMNAVNTEEARRAVKQNEHLGRLTFLATIFIPLNFTSSFLSISPDFPNAKTTIWLFFVIGIPITLFALVIADLAHPAKSGFIMKRLRKFRGKTDPQQAVQKDPLETKGHERRRTLSAPWELIRSGSSFRFSRHPFRNDEL